LEDLNESHLSNEMDAWYYVYLLSFYQGEESRHLRSNLVIETSSSFEALDGDPRPFEPTCSRQAGIQRKSLGCEKDLTFGLG